MKTPITVANRKMHKTLEEVIFFCDSLKRKIEHMKEHNKNELNQLGTIIIAPAFVYLDVCVAFFKDTPEVQISTQTCSSHQQGAYTGEVSATMLASLDVDRVIVGHSERRAYYAESGNTLTQKMQQAYNAGLGVIYCCGEPAKKHNQTHYITQEVSAELLPIIDSLDTEKLIIAYEPRWAIGTGEVPEQRHIEQALGNITTTHDSIRDISLLYGGSVTPENSKHIGAYTGVDGFLVGGASLEVEHFWEIIHPSAS